MSRVLTDLGLVRSRFLKTSRRNEQFKNRLHRCVSQNAISNSKKTFSHTLAFVIHRNLQWKLRDLFKIHYGQTPYILLLHEGYSYRFKGNPMDRGAMMEFALTGFQELDSAEGLTQTIVPRMPTLWDELTDLFQYIIQQRGGLVGTLLMRDSTNGNVNYLTLFCVYVLPVLVLMGLYKLMWSPFNADSNTAERTRVLEESNRSEQLKIDEWMQKHPKSNRTGKKWD